MRPAMPQVEGVEHRFHDLPTGVRVHVAEAGPRDAPAVLAQHGWPQHWWAWRRVIPLLAGEYRVLCPDLRGFGWSEWPADGDFVKQRMADDMLALLDALGLERVRVVGHDWGGWVGMLAVMGSTERFSGLLAIGIGHPWQPTERALRNAHRMLYQLPLAAPWVGEQIVRDGRYPRWMLEEGRRDDAGWSPEEIDAYLDVLRDPQVARASERLYRHFLGRELPSITGGEFRERRLPVPTRLLIGYRDPIGRDAVLGIERHADDGVAEVVDGFGHFLPEEAPELVAERIRAMPE
jgi:pimeloyl-ACP methyl ester carboxylesterase